MRLLQQKEVTKEYTFVTNKDAELTLADIGKGDLSEIPLTIEASRQALSGCGC